MAIITISRQLGSLGSEIARETSERMGYRYLDRESLEVLLVGHGIERTSIDRYDERKQSFWSSISGDRERYLNYLKLAIYEFSRTESGVIVGRGAAALLGEIPGALHTRIIAPHKVRLKRVMESESCSKQHAEHLIQDSDRDSSGFHKFFFNADWNDDGLYDLVLNTRRLTIEEVAVIIVQSAKSRDHKELKAETDTRLHDLLLAQQVLIEILYQRRIPVTSIRVKADGGKILLIGSVTSGQSVDACEQAARSVVGVQEVHNQIVHLSTTYTVPHGVIGTS